MSPGTPGCFLKAYEEVNGKRLYYKLSNYDSYRGVFGHECVNELIVSRVMDILRIPHVKYKLIHAQIIIDGKEQETGLSAEKTGSILVELSILGLIREISRHYYVKIQT